MKSNLCMLMTRTGGSGIQSQWPIASPHSATSITRSMAPAVRWIELQAEIQFDVAKVSHTGSACDVDKDEHAGLEDVRNAWRRVSAAAAAAAAAWRAAHRQ